MDILPPEILHHVFSYLNWEDLCGAADVVCWQWYAAERSLPSTFLDLEELGSTRTRFSGHLLTSINGKAPKTKSNSIGPFRYLISHRPDLISRASNLRLPPCVQPFDAIAIDAFRLACTNLRQLSLERCAGLASTTVHAIANLCTNLESLNLRCVRLLDKDLDALENLPFLTKLDVRHCLSLAEERPLVQRKGGQPLTSLRVLTLPRYISNTFVASLSRDAPHLEVLSIKNCPYIFGAALESLPVTLTELNIYRCDVVAEAVEFMAARCTNLRVLHIMGLGGVHRYDQLLHNALPHIPLLEHLSVQCKPSCESVLPEIIRSCRNLSSLQLRFSDSDNLVVMKDLTTRLTALQLLWTTDTAPANPLRCLVPLKRMTRLRRFALRSHSSFFNSESAAYLLGESIQNVTKLDIMCDSDQISRVLRRANSVQCLALHRSRHASLIDFEELIVRQNSLPLLCRLTLSGDSNWVLLEPELDVMKKNEPLLQVILQPHNGPLTS